MDMDSIPAHNAIVFDGAKSRISLPKAQSYL